MPKVTEFSVIIDSDVFSWIAEQLEKNYPLESGVFLFGNYWNLDSRHNVPYITLAREPSEIGHFSDSFEFYHTEFIRQTKLAAAEGKMLLGWAHSHPWRHSFIGMNNQSITDARTQIFYRFTVSFIFGLWPNNWWVTAWKEGFAAPLNILVIKGKKLMTCKQWYYQKYKRKPWDYFRLDKGLKI